MQIRKCMDYGTNYCPCELAQCNQCIICDELKDMDIKCDCNCKNSKGFCVYTEFLFNNRKAKDDRKVYSCKVYEKKEIEKNLFTLEAILPRELFIQINMPSSFIFIKGAGLNDNFFTPISIYKKNDERNSVTLLIENKGAKTNSIYDSKETCVDIKGPYWNGLHGIDNLKKCKNETSLIIARGVGAAPIISIIKDLSERLNKVICLIDMEGFENNFIEEDLEKINCKAYDVKIICDGKISTAFVDFVKDVVKKEKVSLISILSADFIIKSVIDDLSEFSEINYCCSNNAKMCCGEGVCGSCSVRFKGNRIRKLCKEQMDPKELFVDRRFI
ncbi:MAG: sulfide/dihydroorotate dehydrogenase-like FAD/NAD-binding protein [Oscillospiraceae bacterium]|nr:sulfide/dihydroorotate dehydrogenase-like FAD/NAD-binding protein [Oscillospiraceae bacterium]